MLQSMANPLLRLTKNLNTVKRRPAEGIALIITEPNLVLLIF